MDETTNTKTPSVLAPAAEAPIGNITGESAKKDVPVLKELLKFDPLEKDPFKARHVSPLVAAEIDRMFTYLPWDEDMVKAGTEVREAIANAFKAIVNNVPPSPRRTLALQHLVTARLDANTAITFKGQY